MRILVTGGSGFVGSALVSHLCADGQYAVRVATRGRVTTLPHGVEAIPGCDLAQETDWRPALNGVDVVVHTAARVHVMRERASNPLDEFRRVNLHGTLRLATQAQAAGVRRFIFISSIKVNGESTRRNRPFSADDDVSPADPYAISKAETEVALWRLAAESGMEVVVIRPVLVYGVGVRANFLSMMHWLSRGLPLPFAAVENSRSLLALDNLVDLIECCIAHPKAANQTFLASDGVDLSTPDLLRSLGDSLGKPARLFPVPPWVLRLVAGALGQGGRAQRLLGSLQVDISKNESLLGWRPPVEQARAFAATVEWYLESK
jgi:nucleoside-diphosphate-sugar epimerase